MANGSPLTLLCAYSFINYSACTTPYNCDTQTFPGVNQPANHIQESCLRTLVPTMTYVQSRTSVLLANTLLNRTATQAR